MSTTTTSQKDRCPLDGALTEDLGLEYRVCTVCAELLEPSELVAKATHVTRNTYLKNGHTDTSPENAPKLPALAGLLGVRRNEPPKDPS